MLLGASLHPPSSIVNYGKDECQILETPPASQRLFIICGLRELDLILVTRKWLIGVRIGSIQILSNLSVSLRRKQHQNLRRFLRGASGRDRSALLCSLLASALILTAAS